MYYDLLSFFYCLRGPDHRGPRQSEPDWSRPRDNTGFERRDSILRIPRDGRRVSGHYSEETNDQGDRTKWRAAHRTQSTGCSIIGAVGPLSDAQLVDRFVARRDEAAEAAFEELVNRHGPMVLRVCRSVLHCEHDAEDAFQAVFLVLANRASSIRGSGSVASWLFGVAQRVANRSKRSAARRNALNQLVAGRTSESYLPAEYDPDWEILHEEIAGLPEQLRAPVVLCCLQGLTYAAAAHQLALSEMAVRGRLARARDRLRQRLTGRGVTVPGGLVVAGAAGQARRPFR